jgi:benzaldehyde dehydrogenase (NAD)
MQMSPILDASTWEGKVFTGRWTEPRGGTIDDMEPATGEVLTRVGSADAQDVAAACEAAAKAQPDWAARAHEERARILLDAAGLIRDNYEELAAWIMRECGGIRAKATTELDDAIQRLTHSAGLTGEAFGHMIPTAVPGRMSFAQRVPIGVVGVISPFNFPLILSIRSVAPALAVGNAVVLKPDGRTPICGGYLIARVLEEAGLPEGVFHVLPGLGADAGDALVKDANNQMISFTGSTPVGRAIGEAAGRVLKRVSLELGGNNPFVVLEDADVELAASGGAFGSFMHQGQICMATGRHIVHEKIADAYVDALTRTASALRVGDPFREEVEIGPIIDQRQLEHIDDLVQRSIQGGGRATTGADYEQLFYRPTVLVDIATEAPAYHDEIFGPVAPVVTFRDDDEAVALANGTAYGLKAALHSGSYEHALAVGQRLEAGAVHINDVTVNDEAVAPFPAIKASGNQTAFGGPADAGEFTRWQWTTTRETPSAMPIGGA